MTEPVSGDVFVREKPHKVRVHLATTWQERNAISLPEASEGVLQGISNVRGGS